MIQVRWSSCQGQALVEIAIVLPLVLFALTAMVQVGLLMRTQMNLEMAARMGLRLVAAGRDARKPMQEFLQANSVIPGLEYAIHAGRSSLYVDEVVVECDFPVFRVFHGIFGPSIHLQARLTAHGGGLSVVEWLSSIFS